MARSFTKVARLPTDLEHVLSLRINKYEASPKVKELLSAIPFFNTTKISEESGPWRGMKVTHVESDDGFRTWKNGKNKKGGSMGKIDAAPSYISHSYHVASKSALSGLKDSKTQTELIMDRIRGKINKLCRDSYSETVDSISMVLDSGQVEFINNFIKEVFNCAANQTDVFCQLYANLLHELAEKYEQIRNELNMLFQNYILAFDETSGKPDVGTEDYMKFVEAQEAKRHRKGYSQFVAELVKLGEIEIEPFVRLIITMVNSINTSRKVEENKVLCEEYADCLKILCTVGCNILKNHKDTPALITLLRTIVSDSKPDNPGMSNKGKFALMDVIEFAERGWVPRS